MSNAVVLLVLLWPLLLAAMLAFAGTRPMALRSVPWAAVPALLLSLAGSGTLTLPSLLLGSGVQLDGTGRAFLFLAATLSLLSGFLARGQIAKRRGGYHFAALFLLASTGAFGAALAGDALLFFTATTLLGYGLYGMLAVELRGAGAIGRVFVFLLVVSDLLIFELLLILAHDAGATTFSLLHRALLLAESPGLVLFLLLAGFGAKFGLLGLHLWLGPVLELGSAAVRAMVLVFVFCAGMLGWLRLLPLGEVYWPDAGLLLQSLALVNLAYAVIVGLIQERTRWLLVCGVVALAGLFLWLLGAVLAEPGLWPSLYLPLQRALPQAAFALAALSLLPEHAGGGQVPGWHRAVLPGVWVASLLLAEAPLELALFATPASSFTLSAIAAALALLGGRFLRIRCTSIRPATLLAGALVSLAALLAVSSALFTRPLGPLGWPVLLLVSAGGVGWLGGGSLARRLPFGPPGMLLAPLDRSVTTQLGRALRLLDRELPRWRKSARHLAYTLRDELALRKIEVHTERRLARWPMAMLMVVLLGLLLAWWASPL
jgi:hydrogenase-4 component B